MSDSKLVFAHFIVGNSHPYTFNDWVEDILKASRHLLDGFVLNVGRDDWQLDRVADCYEAARQFSRSSNGRSFKLFISFDLAVIPGAEKEDVALLQQYIARFGRHPNQLVYKRGVVVSTFAGQDCTFGKNDLDSGWRFVKDLLEHVVERPIHFIPSFFIDPRRYSTMPWLNGYFHWNGGWPIHLKPSDPRSKIHNPSLDSDTEHLRHLEGKTYMAAVSPCFFTHYGEDSWNKNWIYRSDDHLLVRRWEHLINSNIADRIDIVQVISWNDYGESHYLSSPRYPACQPNSNKWVDGFPHEGWLDLNAWFIHAFKLRQSLGGSQGTCNTYLAMNINRNISTRENKARIWMWGRPHLKGADASDDTVGKPKGWQLADDTFDIVVVSPYPDTFLEVTCGPPISHHRRVYRNLSPGRLHRFSHPMYPGFSMKATLRVGRESSLQQSEDDIEAEGVVVAVCDSETYGFRFLHNFEVENYNFNSFVCMSD
ncbi:Glycoside hydrolase family 71 [Abortiporus biennis]